MMNDKINMMVTDGLMQAAGKPALSERFSSKVKKAMAVVLASGAVIMGMGASPNADAQYFPNQGGPVMNPPAKNCGILSTGSVLGGALGGILGNQVGNGTGKTIATIGAAILGSGAGRQIEGCNQTPAPPGNRTVSQQQQQYPAPVNQVPLYAQFGMIDAVTLGLNGQLQQYLPAGTVLHSVDENPRLKMALDQGMAQLHERTDALNQSRVNYNRIYTDGKYAVTPGDARQAQILLDAASKDHYKKQQEFAAFGVAPMMSLLGKAVTGHMDQTGQGKIFDVQPYAQVLMIIHAANIDQRIGVKAAAVAPNNPVVGAVYRP